MLDDLTRTRDDHELIQPVNPLTLVKFIQTGDSKGFIEYFEALKAKYSAMYNDQGQAELRKSDLEALPSDVKEEVQLFRHVGYQVSQTYQDVAIDFLPQDEVVMHFLYNMEEEDNNDIV